jgi:hypothetical protein
MRNTAKRPRTGEPLQCVIDLMVEGKVEQGFLREEAQMMVPLRLFLNRILAEVNYE